MSNDSGTEGESAARAGRSSAPEGGRSPLVAVAALFLRIGATAFGGPAAHIAFMEEEVVRRRGWLTRERFLDYVGATSLIPGPNSTELAILIGYARAGWPGLVVAGVCFILPAALIVTGLASAYVRYGALPEVGGILYGIKPVVIAIVAQALWTLGRTAIKTAGLAILAALAVIAAAAGVHELLVLAASGLVVGLARGARRPGSTSGPNVGVSAVIPIGVLSATGAAATAPGPVGLAALFGVFVKIGAVLFGSGYVLLAFLRTDLVQRLGWISERQLLDAVAAGQVTPGPVLTTATFVGYLVAGGTGALVATAGIFLPAFLLVALSGPLIPRLRRSRAAGAFLDGVNVGSLALMAVVGAQLAGAAIVDVVTACLAVTSAALLIVFRINPTWLVLGGGFVGFALHRS